jgi:hypothetical protein
VHCTTCCRSRHVSNEPSKLSIANRVKLSVGICGREQIGDWRSAVS